MMTNYILRGGEVIDGSGRARFRADVAISGDRISEVGAVGKVAGAREIDVSGKVVAPGFIDVHTHDDRALFATPEMAAKASQGVTTVVTGNCGISLAPLAIDHAPPPPLDLIGDAADYRYGRFADYLAALDRSPAAVNAACLVGHSTLRVGSMTALDRPAASAEIRQMRELLQEALDAGAIGMSSGLAYAPAEHAPPAEIENLAALLHPAGALYTTHMRNEGEHVLESLDESFAVGRAAGDTGRDLASQNHRPGQFWPHRRDAARHRRSDTRAGGRPRRLPLYRVIDRAERGSGRARLKGDGHLVEKRAGAGRTRTRGNRCRLGAQHRGRSQPAAARGRNLLDNG